MNREQRVLVVVGAGELEVEFEGTQLLLEPDEVAVEIVVRQALSEEFLPGGELLLVFDQPVVRLKLTFDGAPLAQYGSAPGLVLPETRTLGFLVEFGYSCFERRGVKDTPGAE